jgi:hypothetical protein
VHALRPGAVIIRKPYREPDLAQAIQRAIGTETVRTSVGNLAVPRGRTRPSDQSPSCSRTRLSRRRTS